MRVLAQRQLVTAIDSFRQLKTASDSRASTLLVTRHRTTRTSAVHCQQLHHWHTQQQRGLAAAAQREEEEGVALPPLLLLLLLREEEGSCCCCGGGGISPYSEE